jgi:hypothetical protein
MSYFLRVLAIDLELAGDTRRAVGIERNGGVFPLSGGVGMYGEYVSKQRFAIPYIQQGLLLALGFADRKHLPRAGDLSGESLLVVIPFPPWRSRSGGDLYIGLDAPIRNNMRGVI